MDFGENDEDFEGYQEADDKVAKYDEVRPLGMV